jgi:hypothetical protein
MGDIPRGCRVRIKQMCDNAELQGKWVIVMQPQVESGKVCGYWVSWEGPHKLVSIKDIDGRWRNNGRPRKG